MKKLLALLMVCGFAFAFVACGGGEQQSEETTAPETETPAIESEETEAPADSTEVSSDSIQ